MPVAGAVHPICYGVNSRHSLTGSECLMLANSRHSHSDKTFIGRIEKAAIGSLVHAAYEIGVRARR